MFNPICYENSRPNGFGVLEIVGNGSFHKEGEHWFVPLKRTELRGEVPGPLASLCLTQTFGFSSQQYDKAIEAVYRFPLPGDAAVRAVRVRFGDVEITADLKERVRAEEEYRQARKQGRQATLFTRESPDVFSLMVVGIRPDEEVTVETSFVQIARAEGVGWSLRVPLTTSPRYVRSDEIGSPYAQGQPLLLLRDPGHRFALDLTVLRCATVTSSTHDLTTSQEGDRMRVRLRDVEVLPDRDCVISWRPSQESARPSLQVFVHEDGPSGQLYFLEMVSPPAAPPTLGVPREVILLVDHSGSMEGPKWEAADWAVKKFLREMDGADFFALGLFHSTTRWFAGQPQLANPEIVERAVQFLEDHRDSGGTELGVALEQALDMARAPDHFSRHVLVITDAEVTDAGRILRLAEEESRRERRRRISVLCIDAAPNSFVALQLAERGGGLAKFLTSSPDDEDIATALDEVLSDWAQPVLAGLRLEVNRKEAQASGRQVSTTDRDGWAVIDLGDLPVGRTVWVAGRVPRGDNEDLRFSLTSRGEEIATCELDLGASKAKMPSLKALFGAWRILALEQLIHSRYSPGKVADQLRRLGYDPHEVLSAEAKREKLYAENAYRESLDGLRGLLVREALDYGLACSETAFVAVRRELGQVVEDTVPVASALPFGWSSRFEFGGSLGHLPSPSSPTALGAGPGVSLGADDLDVPSFLRRSPSSSRWRPAQMPPTFNRDVGSSRDADDTQTRAFLRRNPLNARQDGFLAGSGAGPIGGSVLLFSGIPIFEDRAAVLFDTARDEDAAKLPESGRFSRLTIAFPDELPVQAEPGPGPGPGPGLALLIFIGDLSSPRARVQPTEVVRHGGERPLNLVRRKGERVRVILLDDGCDWTAKALRIELEVDCNFERVI